jgi:hypothetical protein
MALRLATYGRQHHGWLLLLLAAVPVSAAPPALRNLDRVGLQIGRTNLLTIDGDNLLPAPRLLLSVPIARQTVQPQSTPSRVTIEITLDKATAPGLYNLWLANANGVSAARIVSVDHLPQRAWEAAVGVLPVALEGNLAGSKKLATSFAGKAGQPLLCEVEAQRLGGKVRPVIHLYAENGRQLTWSWPTASLGGDARINTTLPADGRYTVEVHDSQYAAAAPGNFRLKLGTWQYVDAVFPAAVAKGASTWVQLIGNPADLRRQVQAGQEGAPALVPWPDPAAASGTRPWIRVTDLPEIVARDGDPIQDVTAFPVALNGRLAKPGQIDRFRLKVQPGARLRFEVFADRLGSPMDAVLKLQRDNGALLAQADDMPDSPDPVLDFTIPADVQALVVSVEDLHGRSQPNFIYRLTVRSSPTAAAEQDFRLFLANTEINVPPGGSRVVEVDVERHGYNGPIHLAFDSLPAGFQVQGVDVPAGANGALLSVTATGPAPVTALTSLHGTSTDPAWKLTRTATDKNHSLRNLQPWLAHEVVASIGCPEAVAFSPQWGSLPANAKIVPGAIFKVPLTITPPKDAAGGVRFYLLTGHRPPLVNGRPDPNQSLRKDQGAFLELPADKNQGEFVVVVPPTLPNVPLDLAFRAELLGKDKKQVIAQAFTPVRRFAVLNPLVVKLATQRIEVPLDPKNGAEVKVTGKVERLAGFKEDVTVSIAGIPQGIAVPSVAVKCGGSDFQLVLKFPANFTVRDLDKLEVFATGKYDPKSPLLNRSEAAAVRVKLLPAGSSSLPGPTASPPVGKSP